jgi:hypothetical protein
MFEYRYIVVSSYCWNGTHVHNTHLYSIPGIAFTVSIVQARYVSYTDEDMRNLKGHYLRSFGFCLLIENLFFLQSISRPFLWISVRHVFMLSSTYRTALNHEFPSHSSRSPISCAIFTVFITPSFLHHRVLYSALRLYLARSSFRPIFW